MCQKQKPEDQIFLSILNQSVKYWSFKEKKNNELSQEWGPIVGPVTVLAKLLNVDLSEIQSHFRGGNERENQNERAGYNLVTYKVTIWTSRIIKAKI